MQRGHTVNDIVIACRKHSSNTEFSNHNVVTPETNVTLCVN